MQSHAPAGARDPLTTSQNFPDQLRRHLRVPIQLLVPRQKALQLHIAARTTRCKMLLAELSDSFVLRISLSFTTGTSM